jgi:hypothetical protein
VFLICGCVVTHLVRTDFSYSTLCLLHVVLITLIFTSLYCRVVYSIKQNLFLKSTNPLSYIAAQNLMMLTALQYSVPCYCRTAHCRGNYINCCIANGDAGYSKVLTSTLKSICMWRQVVLHPFAIMHFCLLGHSNILQCLMVLSIVSGLQ